MKYDTKKIMKTVQARHKSGKTIRELKRKHDMKVELLEHQSKVDKAKLKIHEDREKRRMEGLKKAQKARKSKGGKKSG